MDLSLQPYRYRLGQVEVLVLPDGYRRFPLAPGFLLNASVPDVNTALMAAGLRPDEMTIVFNPVLLKIGSRNILIDAGNGKARADADPTRNAGLLLENMRKAGVDPSAIDTIVISHFHRDHIDGLLDTAGSPVFPNADILVPSPEWNFWMDDREMARAPAGRMQELFRNSRRVFAPLEQKVRHYEWDAEIAPGLTAIGTPGHSIGHTSFLLSSGAEQLFIQSDVTNHPALFVRNPGWHASFDQDPGQAELTRRRIYDWLAEEQIPVQAFHHPMPGLSLVKKDGSAYRLLPLATPGQPA